MMRSGCSEEVNTGLYYDPRYKPTGLYTDLLSIQNDNSVTSILEAEPHFSDYVTTSNKANFQEISWSRPTLNWDLKCEELGFTRAEALEVVGHPLDSATSSIIGIRTWSCVFLFIYLSNFCMIFFPSINERPDIFYGFVYGCIRLCFLIYAPPVGVLIYRALSANSDAQQLVFDL